MSYEILDTKVTWKGRAVKGADPSSFRTLAGIVGADATAVYVLGKKIAANAKTFGMLGPGYAADMLTVWRVMETKLKPLRADAATFEAIGSDHGRDAKTAFYKDKRLALTRGVSASDLKVLTGSFSTDGVHLFHATKRVARSKDCAIYWLDCEIRCLSRDNDVNVPVGVIRDVSGVWLLDIFGQTTPFVRLTGANFEALRLVSPRFWRAGQSYVTDSTQVWFRGMPVDGARGERAEAITSSILAEDGRIWTGQRLWHLTEEDSAVALMNDRTPHIHTTDGLYQVGRKGEVTKLADVQPGPDGNADARLTHWLRLVVQDFHSILLTLEAGDWPHEGELLSDLRPWGRPREMRAAVVAAPVSDINARFEGDEIIVDGGGLAEPLQDRACAWGRLVQQICLKLMGQMGRYRPVSRLNGYPEGRELHDLLAMRHVVALIDVASALHGTRPQEAKAMLHLIWNRLEYMPDKDAIYTALARMPLGLVESAQYQRNPYGYVEATTHLAGVRHLLSKACLKDPDWRIRFEYAGLLHSLIWATGKPTLVMTEVMHAFDELTAWETHPMVTEVYASMLCVMVAKCDRVLRRPAKGEDIAEVHPWALRKAIDRGVTPARYEAQLDALKGAAG